tara:strand:+ start:3190 stop:3591 length:402 start_codon:yes stop_codon:yes gene_type:complete
MIIIVIKIPNRIAINVFTKSSIKANMINFVSSKPYIIRQNSTDHGKNITMAVERTKNCQKPNLRYGFCNLLYGLGESIKYSLNNVLNYYIKYINLIITKIYNDVCLKTKLLFLSRKLIEYLFNTGGVAESGLL